MGTFILTEDNARTKWCPFVRVVNDFGNAPANRGDVAASETRCIASGCMMWRSVNRMGDQTYVNSLGGYCGLSDRVDKI